MQYGSTSMLSAESTLVARKATQVDGAIVEAKMHTRTVLSAKHTAARC
jgi:hypothetical protein